LGRTNILDSAQRTSTFSGHNIPPYVLKLKENVIAYITRNLEHGWCNGTRVRIGKMGTHTVEVISLSGSTTGQSRILPRITCLFKVFKDVIIMRHQFPLRLAFATTLNKSKGQEYKAVGLDITQDFFAHGQLYVATSRVAEHGDLSLFTTEDRLTADGVPFANNVVYSEVYED
jgi:hypothetical protein